MVTKSLRTVDVWRPTYADDGEIDFIMKLPQPNSDLSEKYLRILHVSYRHPLREHRMKLLNGRIVIVIPIGSINLFLTLIAVPRRLRSTIFHAYYTTPMDAHIKRFKIVLII